MNIKDKLSIILIFTFATVGIFWFYFDEGKCGKYRNLVDEEFDKLASGQKLKQIEIVNGAHGNKLNKTNKITIEDQEQLKILQQMILDLKNIEVTRYSPIWSLRIKFTLQDKSSFEVILNKTLARNEGEFKVYKYGDCEESFSLGSKILGSKIEEIIGEN